MKTLRTVGQIALSTIVGFMVSAILVLITEPIFHGGSDSSMTDAQYDLILVWGVLSLLIVALLSRWIAHRWVKRETTLLDLFVLSLTSAFVGIFLTTIIAEFMGISYRYTSGSAGLSGVFTAKRAFDVLNGYIMFLTTTWLNQFFVWAEMRIKNEKGITNYWKESFVPRAGWDSQTARGFSFHKKCANFAGKPVLTFVGASAPALLHYEGQIGQPKL